MKIIGKKTVYRGRFITAHELECQTKIGTTCIWEMVERNHHGHIVSIFAVTKNKEVILEKIFRVPLNGYNIELPAGLMDKRGEAPYETIARELLEETGYIINHAPISLIKGPFNAGLLADRLEIFYGHDAYKVGEPQLEDVEEIEVILVPLAELVDFVLQPPPDCEADLKLLSALPVLKAKGFIKDF